MKKAFLLPFLITGSLIAVAQQPFPIEEKPFIEVTGSAEKEIIPDEIYISILLKEKNKSNDKGKIEVQEDNLLKQLKTNGFDSNNLTLSGANGDLQYGVFRKNRVITEKRLQMKVQNAGEVNRFFKILDELEIEDAGILRTSHSQLEKYRKEVKIEAMKAARDKADYLLAAVGEQTGKPLLIREQTTVYPGNFYHSNTALQEVVVSGYGSRGRVQGLNNEINYTSIKLRFEIVAKFGIK